MFSSLRQVLANLVGSEKAIAGLVVLLGATAFTLTGKMSVAEWKEMALWVLGIYTVGKTIQGTAATIKGAVTAGADAKAAQDTSAGAQAAVAVVTSALKTNDDAADAALVAKFDKDAKVDV